MALSSDSMQVVCCASGPPGYQFSAADIEAPTQSVGTRSKALATCQALFVPAALPGKFVATAVAKACIPAVGAAKVYTWKTGAVGQLVPSIRLSAKVVVVAPPSEWPHT